MVVETELFSNKNQIYVKMVHSEEVNKFSKNFLISELKVF